MKRVTISMSDKLDQALEVLSNEWGVSKSNLVSCIIGQYFSSISAELFNAAYEENKTLNEYGVLKRPFLDETVKLIGESKNHLMKGRKY